ncbi:hypothetical protein Csp1_19910 [Corynebacterium provencense]|uniref:Uncharacterized protein n=1 Tax=Corynebacterium provencense TaxID=1737425 RepID=A0A2Z3YR92_9CORY|nr:hypothetical protein [Corynebacterium provencense]AWT26759.1 hypothetical protein Csp1_19910 [Corynebacterium provencense]
MAHDQQQSLAFKLRKTKAALLAVSLTLAGILLIMANAWIAGLDLGAWDWVHNIPIAELGATLFGAGFLGTLFEYGFQKDQEAANREAFRRTIVEEAPAIRDAVLQSFAIGPDDLKRVANPDLLDDIAANVMSLRLGDEQFARELYSDIRDQAVRAAERWYDIDVSIHLSSALDRSAYSTPVFDVTVTWEYTTVPSGPTRRFACVSNRAEYADLREDIPATSTWMMTPRPGVDPSKRESYELLEFTVDGHQQPIRRSTRRGGQVYSVTLDNELLHDEPVRIRQTFRTVTPTWGHRLFFELPQPGRDISLTVDYTNTDIIDMRVSDTVSGAKPVIVSRSPAEVPERVMKMDATGWLMPKSGFAFTWALESELPEAEAQDNSLLDA